MVTFLQNQDIFVKYFQQNYSGTFIEEGFQFRRLCNEKNQSLEDQIEYIYIQRTKALKILRILGK